MADPKIGSLEELDKQFKKKFGGWYGKNREISKVNFLPTNILSLDRMLGGGIPEGRIIEIYGQPSSSKTTLSYHILNSFQQRGQAVIWIDVEKAFDREYARYCGVDIDSMGLLEPETGNEALEAMRMIADSGVVSLVILDSIAAIVPEEEFEKDVGQSQVGSLARLMSQSVKQIVSLTAKTKCTAIYINQVRAANMMGYGPKTTTPGGSAMDFYSSVRIECKKVGDIESGGARVGVNVNYKTTKNKVHTPFKTAEVDIYHPYSYKDTMVAGIDIYGDVIDVAMKEDIIDKSGSWLQYGEIKLQGKDKFRTYLLENPLVYEQLDKQVRGLPI